MKHLAFLSVGVTLLSVVPALGVGAPVGVSPGDAAQLALIGDICPTFSWGEVEGARWYDLVVYRLEDEEQTEPVLRERITGSALSWTPSLDRCLEAGGKYAWSARAVSSWKASDWSAPSLFQVASGPSAAEFEEALAVVRKYLSGQDDRTAESAGGWESSSETITAPVTALSAPATTRLNVDGNVHAESFTGDGSHLSGVATAVYDGGNSSIALSSTPGAVASVTVDQGTSGRVILVSSANVWGNLSQGDAECSITTSSSTIDSNYRQRAQTFTDAHATIAGTRGYKINKGLFFPPPDTQVYHLVCREGLGDTWILDANLSAIFVPDPAVFEKPPFPLD